MISIITIGFGFLNAQPGTGVTGADGFACRGFTNDAELNRMLCRYHPVRLWNMPVTEALPFLAPKEPTAD